MKTKEIILIFGAILFLSVACNNNNSKKAESRISIKKTAQIEKSGGNKIYGTYYGVLPCASCPGIFVIITLNENGTFEKDIQYMGRENEDVSETTRGVYKWSEDKTKIIMEDESYLVGEKQITMLDANGETIKGELAANYVFHSTELQLAPDINEGYTLQQFTGSDNKNYNIIFNTNSKIPTALVQSGNTSITLTQTEVWAKGAVYKGNNVKLSVQDNKGTLILDKKKITLKEY